MKNHHVFKLFFLSIALAILAGCGEDEDLDPTDNSTYYIVFKADGNSVSFNGNQNENNVVGTFNTINTNQTDQYASTIIAVSEDGTRNFSILIGTLGEAQPNTVYTNYNTDSPKIKVDTFVSAYTENSNSTSYGSFIDDLILVINGTVADCEITFTSVSSTVLEGTFSGTFYDMKGEVIPMAITEGKFKVRRY